MNSLPQTPLVTDVPSKEFVAQVSSLVKNTLSKSGWVLSCEDIDLTTDEVSSEDGLLPLVMWISGQTLEKIWGPQDLVFRCDSSALCGVIPDLCRPILSQSIWLHAIHFEIERTVKKTVDGPAIIDDWFKRWNEALAQKKILLLPPKTPNPEKTQGV